MKTKKRQKNTRHRGTHTHGTGFKKKGRGKGHRGGIGNAGTGKRADHKKNLKINPPGKDKTLRAKKRITLKVINLREISEKYKGKKKISLLGYKVLSVGDLREKLVITASAASIVAQEKIKKAGGDIILN